jgi:glycosyltransferase involved in cell wall biosynthesis
VTDVLVVRGHQATPWELAPWAELPDGYDVAFLRTTSNAYDTAALPLRAVTARTLRDRLPRGRVGDVLARAAGDRYLGATRAFAAADIVHAEELSYWFAADAARRRLAGGRFKLVQTVWETLPMGAVYRNGRARRWRSEVLAATDLFLAATERARDGLLLEGVEAERIVVAAPGIDVGRFRVAAADPPPAEHVILSAGRLVWEKGHHDVLRAVAALHRGLVDGATATPRVLIVGAGPEAGRLREHADELGIGDRVELRPFVPYEEMPALYAGASCLVLASLSSASMGLHPFDVPRAFWEEQFGMVLAEAMAAGLDIVASRSGAIPEVLDGQGTLFTPGDVLGLARGLASGPLARPPGTRVPYPEELVQGYSTTAAAERLAAAYERVLGA